MSAPETTKKSFFSGLHLVITGLAALTTAAVAVLGLSLNQGWIGGGNSSKGGTPTASTTAAPQYLVAPGSISFTAVGPLSKVVEVSNSGVVPLTVESPTVTGHDATHFSASLGTCETPVDPGRSCQLQVAFHQALGTFNTTMVVKVEGAVRETEVPVTAAPL